MFTRSGRIAALAFSAIVLAPVPAALAATTTPQQQTYTFVLAPGGMHEIALPIAQTPIQLTASLTARNGGTQTPSALISSVINQDQTSFQLTWISTNGDGSQIVGNTLGNSTVAEFASSNCVVTATAGTSTSKGRLIFTQSSITTSIPISYTVIMDY